MASSTLRQRLPVEIIESKEIDGNSSSSDSDSGIESDDGLPTFTPPMYTIKELLACIPAHCFERSALKSFQYVAQDFAMITAVVYAATFIDPAFGSNGSVLQGWAGFATKWALWNAVWLMLGWNGTGVWIMAHECGHQAFSTSKTLNNSVGLVLHSLVLVPFHSWRISHSKHHAATGHMTREEVFVPSTRSTKVKPVGERRIVQKDGVDMEELLEDAPIYRLYYLLVQQLFGWPAYLIMNASGQSFYPKWTNHYDPASLLFDARHRTDVILSDVGLLVVLGALSVVGHYHGLSAVVKYYGIPYLYVNHWLVMITYLQHTDPQLPHYRSSEFTFARGALATIDRTMLGPVGVWLMHSICETHVAHHLSSKIPHHHGREATEALKKKLGPHYHSTDENMFVSLWKNYKSCRFVEDEGEVVFYKDAFGKASRKYLKEPVESDSGVDVL